MPRGKAHAVSLTAGSVARVFLFAIGMWFAWLVRDVFAVLFVALLLAAVIDPWVHVLEGKGLPRGVAALMIYAVFAAAVFALVSLLLPPLISQAGAIGKGMANVVAMGKEWLGSSQILFTSYGISPARVELWAGAAERSVITGLEHIFSTLTVLLSHTIGAMIVFVLAYYFVVEEDAVRGALKHLTPTRWRAYAIGLTRRIQARLGEWVRGQAILMLAIWALTYGALLILGVPYALLLSVFAGLLELIPYAGPTLSAIPIVLMAATISPSHAAIALAICVVIQQVENNVLVPKVMEYSVGLSPIVSMLALMIGYTLGGMLGALLAIPAATALMVFLEDVFAAPT